MIEFDLGAVETAILLGMVAGVIEMIKRAFEKDWKSVAIIAGAGVTGALVGLAISINPLIVEAIMFFSSCLSLV